jgi:hypothetical protein
VTGANINPNPSKKHPPRLNEVAQDLRISIVQRTMAPVKRRRAGLANTVSPESIPEKNHCHGARVCTLCRSCHKRSKVRKSTNVTGRIFRL